VKVYSLGLPSDRLPVQTAVCSSDKAIFEWMMKEIRKGHQCYVVCPLIEEAEDGSKMTGVSSIEETSKKYQQYFGTAGIKLGVVTGKTPKEEQAAIIKDFKNNAIQILMATTVIEVGVNVPNATVIVITGAERFGLATLHQLRGRVGRSNLQSYCILQKSENTGSGSNLDILCKEHDGLKIAEADLKNRGTGDLFGREQSGKNNFVKLMLQYPNMYRKVREIAVQLCESGTGLDYISKYEALYLEREE
jgi:ATP-dependent DNA helicase RecG